MRPVLKLLSKLTGNEEVWIVWPRSWVEKYDYLLVVICGSWSPGNCLMMRGERLLDSSFQVEYRLPKEYCGSVT